MKVEQIKAVYFVGIGGIGMSAIARYFISRGVVVAGYDKTPSDLTEQLCKEGVPPVTCPGLPSLRRR